MKHVFLSFVMTLLIGVKVCQADDTSKLIVTFKSGGAKEIELTKIGKLTFGKDNMSILMSDGSTETLDILDIQKMTFDAQISSIINEKVEANAGKNILISFEDKIMTFTERDGKEIEVAVFSLDGALILKRSGIGKLQVDFTDLNSNAYIIKANDKTIKFIN